MEYTSGFPHAIRGISDRGVHADLYLRESPTPGLRHPVASDHGGIGIGHSRLEVEVAAHRHGVIKGARIERKESRACASECRDAAESELEGLLQKIATEDHEVVQVSEGGLHDMNSLEHRLLHVNDVGRPLQATMRIYAW